MRAVAREERSFAGSSVHLCVVGFTHYKKFLGKENTWNMLCDSAVRTAS